MQRGRVAHAPAAEKCTRFLFASETKEFSTMAPSLPFLETHSACSAMALTHFTSEIESILLTHYHSIYRVFTDVLDVLHFCLIF